MGLIIFDIDCCLAELTAKQKGFLKFRSKDMTWENDFYCDIPLQRKIPIYEDVVEQFWRDKKWDCFFSTGRSEKYRKETEEWLLNNFDITFHKNKNQLRMRPENDLRHSSHIKQDNLPDIRPDVCFAIEDDPACQRMYMRHGFLLIG